MRHLAFIRIAIGSWFFIDILSMLVSGYTKEAYVDAKMHFPFYGLEWIPVLPPFFIYLLFTLLAIAAVGIIFGKYMHFALLFFLIGFSYIFMLDIVYTLNKFYLFLLLAFYLLFLPADRDISLRVKNNPGERLDTIPYWVILIFQLQLGIIYFFSGLSKLNYDWIYLAQPLTIFFSYKWPFSMLGTGDINLLAHFFSIGGLFFDLSIIFLLLNKRTRYFGQLWQTAFHTLNFVILSIGSLSIFMCLLTWLLFPTPYLRRKLKLKAISQQVVREDFIKYKHVVITALALCLVLHLIIPFRHYVHGNDVNWTEKGHRFSWRLMTRTKTGSSASFEVIDPTTNKSWKIRWTDYLTPRQYRKLSGETDLIISFAHYLKNEWKAKGYEKVIVKANVRTRLNGSTPAYLISPDLDLTTVSRSFLTDHVSLPRPE